MFRRLPDRLHVREEPLRFLGIEIGRICTVVRLSSGGLFVRSPARLTPELERALDDLGDVRFVVPASKLHGHLHMEEYREAYPCAELFAALGLAARRPVLEFDRLLGSVPDSRWSADVDQAAVMGNGLITEFAFYPRPSRPSCWATSATTSRARRRSRRGCWPPCTASTAGSVRHRISGGRSGTIGRFAPRFGGSRVGVRPRDPRSRVDRRDRWPGGVPRWLRAGSMNV